MFLDRLPRQTLAPEATEGREGFLHPYEISGDVAEVVIKVLIRDFDSSALERYANHVRRIAAAVEQEVQGATIAVAIEPQYRNMADGLQADPRAVEYAQRAHARLGRTARLTIVRGGTDGSLLTANGLPTPNLSSGQHTPHSPLEWACLDEMVQAVELVVELVQIWGEKTPAEDARKRGTGDRRWHIFVAHSAVCAAIQRRHVDRGAGNIESLGILRRGVRRRRLINLRWFR